MSLQNLTRFPRLELIGAPTPLEYLPRLSDQHEQLDFSAKAFNPLVHLRLLIIAAANQNRLQQDARQNVLGVCAFVEIFELFHTFHSLSFVDY